MLLKGSDGRYECTVVVEADGKDPRPGEDDVGAGISARFRASSFVKARHPPGAAGEGSEMPREDPICVRARQVEGEQRRAHHEGPRGAHVHGRRPGHDVVDWFDENTHGNIDMTGNQVFGWIDLAISKDGTAPPPARTARNSTSPRAPRPPRPGSTSPGFTAVVAVTNIGVGVWGGTGNVACSADNGTQPFWAQGNIAPSVLCQEMIHGLGVYEHMCRNGSDTPNQDP